MRKLILSGWVGLISLTFPLMVKAQTYDWAMKVGGNTTDQANAVTVDASNNVIVGGWISNSPNGNVAFDPIGGLTYNLGATVNGDAYIAKYTSGGSLIKAYKWTSTQDDKVNDLCTDPSGNIYATGYAKGTTTVDPAFATSNLACPSPGAIVLVKLPSNFSPTSSPPAVGSSWAFMISDATGASGNAGYGIVADATGTYIYVTGTFAGTNVEFNPLTPGPSTKLSTSSSTDINGFVAKYAAATGQLQWVINIGSTSYDASYSIALDASNNVYVGGIFGATVDFDPGASTANLSEYNNITASGDGFIAKYSSAGAYQWAIPISGSTLLEQVKAIAVTSTGTVYVTGTFLTTAAPYTNFNPSGTAELISAGLNDMFVASYTTAGAYVWAKRAGGTTDDAGLGITTDASGQVYVTGYTSTGSGTVNFGTEAITVVGGKDAFYAKYNGSDGTNLFAKGIGGTGDDLTSSVVIDGTSSIVVVGSFNGTSVDFDPSGTTNALTSSATDIFHARYTQCAAPVIGTPPVAQNVCTGDAVTFTVGATGGTLSYQWKRGTTDVGTNSATLSIPAAAAGDVGSYTVVVSNTCPASVTSTAVALTLKTTTSITTQPYLSSPLPFCSGQTLNLTTVAAGTNLTYQWKQGTTNVGTSAATYTKASASGLDNGSYTVVVTGDCGTVTSSAFVVTVGATTGITTHPSFTGPVCVGSTLTLSVGGVTGSNLTYQWKQGTTNVGTSSATYTKTAAVTDNGSYTVVVTGDCGTVTSNATTVTISTPPTITTQPTAQNVCSGTAASFTVAASGSGTLAYQWKLGSTNVGSNSATYNIASAGAGDVGSYTVVVSNGCTPAATSNAVALSLKTATSITTQPSFSGPVCAGSPLSLSVVAAGNGTLSYVWKQGTTTVGGSTATYTKASSATTDDGSYTVAVTGDCGTVTSNATTVTISTPPTITTQPTAQNVCSGTAASFTVAASGSGTLAYQWKLGSTNVGSNSATYNIASAGAGDVGSYTVVVSNGCTPAATSTAVALSLKTATSITTQPSFSGPVCAGSPLTLSIVAAGNGTLSYVWKQGTTTVGTNSATYTKTAATTDDGSYTVAVTGDCGTVTSNATTVTISTPPTITTQPTAQNVCAGTATSFTVAASGSGTLAYQWKLGSTNVGSNSATYNIASAAAGDVGSYTVVVSNGCTPAATSNAVALSLKTATSITTQPSFSGPVCVGSSLTLSVVAAGNGTLSYVWKQGTTTVGTNSATYTKTAATTDDGSYTVVVTGDCGPVVSNVATVTISTPPSITTQPTAQSICSGSPASFTVVASGSAPLTYQWKKGSTNVGPNAATYTIASPVAGDVGSYSVVVSNVCSPSATSNSVALAIGTTTAITTQPTFIGTVCSGTTLSLSVVATGSNLTYQWKQGTTNVGTSSSTYSKTAAVSDNGSYTVVVTGDCGTVTSNAAAVTISTPPAITTQPTAQSACPGSAASFTVVATGAGLHYQWFKGGSTAVGIDDDTYTIPSVVAGDAGNYSVTVTGTCAPTTATSSSVALTVGGSAVINTQPQSQSVCVGSTTTFTVVASGSGLSYQWKKGGLDIGSATTDTYVINNTAVADAGSYTVSVSSSCGTPVLSAPAAVLTVKTLPSITTQPSAQTVCSGSGLNVSVLASGSSLTYLWSHNGSPISGSNSSTYHVNAASAADAGNYSVLISNGCAPDVTSNTVAVTVNELPAITTQPVNAAVCAAGQSATFNITATGTGLTYQWVKNGVTNVGPNSDTYTIPAVAVGDVGNYAVTVSGACTPAVTSNTVTLSISTASVTIVTQPVGQALCIGDDLNLTVAATGPSLSYQWKKGTTNLSDAGSVSGSGTSNLTISNVVTGDAGTYSCLITSTCASPATSDAVAVTVSTCTGVIAQQGNMFYISPNPGADNFYLNASGIEDGEAIITVMNTLGTEIWKGNAVISGGALQQLLRADLSSGVYTVILSNGNAKYVTKLVVQE